MPEPNSLFPALDGSTPGDNPEKVQSLEGLGPLPDLEESQTVSEPGSSQILPIDSLPSVAEPPAGAPVQTSPGDGRSRLQDRINRLVGQRHEQNRENQVLQAQIAALTEQLSIANQRSAGLIAPRSPASPAPGSSSDPFGGSQSQQTPARGFDESALDEALNRRLQPVLESIEGQRRVAEIRTAHEAAFEEAAREFPELRRQDSAFRQRFNELYDRSPLRQLPDAPYQIALQVRGLLADERAASRIVEGRKAVSGVQVPTQPQDTRSEVNGVPIAEYRKYEEAKQAMRMGTATVQQRMHVQRVGAFLQMRKQ